MLAVPSHTPASGAVRSGDGVPFGIATWADEVAFWAADPRRRESDEVDLGATWRRPGSVDAWKLSWLPGTGELYLSRLVGHPASSADVTVLATVGSEQELDALLEGWRDHRADEDGLTWLASRLTPAPRCA